MKQKYITTIVVAIPLCLLIIVLVMKHGPRVQDAAAPAPPTGVCKLAPDSLCATWNPPTCPEETVLCKKQVSQSDCIYNPTTVPPITKGMCSWVPAPKPSPSPHKPSPPKPSPSPPKPSPSPPKPSPSPPKPSPSPPKPSPSPPKPAPAPSQGSCVLTDGKSSVYKSVCEKQKTENACLVAKDTCTWVPPLPPRPKPSPAMACNPNLIWTDPVNAAGVTPVLLQPPYDSILKTCYAYGVHPYCPGSKDKKTCEAASDGGDLGKCRWDSKNSKCLYDLDHMRNQCNSSVQITNARFPKNPDQSTLGVPTQFENCKWVQQKCTPNGNACPKGQTCVKGYCTFGDDDSGGYSENDMVWPQPSFMHNPMGGETQPVWCVPQSGDLLGDQGVKGGNMIMHKNQTAVCTPPHDFKVAGYSSSGKIDASKCALDKLQVQLNAKALPLPPPLNPNDKFVVVDQTGGNKIHDNVFCA
jgi:hypothetical protein